MPKPDFNNKLNKLFSGIQEDNGLANPLTIDSKTLSFSWECDATGFTPNAPRKLLNYLGIIPRIL